jgi:hypothetical protein
MGFYQIDDMFYVLFSGSNNVNNVGEYDESQPERTDRRKDGSD